jgi:hypothetical protein
MYEIKCPQFFRICQGNNAIYHPNGIEKINFNISISDFDLSIAELESIEDLLNVNGLDAKKAEIINRLKKVEPIIEGNWNTNDAKYLQKQDDGLIYSPIELMNTLLHYLK